MKDRELSLNSNVLPFRPLAKNTKAISRRKTYKVNPYNLSYVLGKYVMRANNPEKSLSSMACWLAIHYYDMINDSLEDYIYVNHAYISNNITKRSKAQNRNYHNELRNLFDIQRCQSLIIDGERCYLFKIQFTKSGESLLKKLFSNSFVLKEINLLEKNL